MRCFDKIEIYNLEQKQLVDQVQFDICQQVELFPDGQKFVITENGKFYFSNIDKLKSYQKLSQFNGHQKAINQVVISQSFAFMATLCRQQFIKLWNIEDINNPKVILIFQDQHTKKLQFSLDSTFFSRSSYRTITCIQLNNFQIPVQQLSINKKILGIKQKKLQNCKELMLYISETTLFFKEDIQQQNENIFLTFPSKLYTYTFSSDSNKFAYADLDGKIYQYQIEDQKCNLLQLHLQQNKTGPINSLCFSPNGNLLFSGGQDGAIRVWDSKKEAQFFCSTNESDSIKCLVFNPNNVYFAVGSSDGSVGLFLTNILKKKLDKKQNLIECLENNDQIGCLKLFAQQSLFSAYESNFENRNKQDKDDVGLAKLFYQKLGRVQQDIKEIQEIE